ncbi:hypothetical protein LTR17_024581 [Elasticomyces elasticus]|nr:hypothetical protein LTR17_024581 [Elasticomyces elasticus]
MKALVLNAEARTAHLQSVPRPSPAPNELLIRVHAIGLNPIDPLYVSTPLGATGRTIGSDFAGIIAALGAHVPPSSEFRLGDRVSGFLQGACSTNPRPGAFAEFLVVPWDLVWKVPEGVGIEEAAGVSLVALTAAQAVWYCLGLRAPVAYDREGKWAEHPDWRAFQSRDMERGTGTELKFFVYGASTSVGMFAAQFIRLSAEASGKRIKLFGAASKAKHEFLKQEPYSYDHLVDYRDPDWDQQIRNLAGGEEMDYVYDCVSEGESVERASRLLREGGRSMVVRSRAGGAWWTADDLPVEPIYNAVWEGLGEDVEYQGMDLKKSVAARGFAVALYQWLGKVVGTEVKAVPVRVMPGGLERVVGDGFALLGVGGMGDREMKRGEEWMRPVSAEKLVCRI